MNVQKIEITGQDSYNVYFDDVVCQVDWENELIFTRADVQVMIAGGEIPVESLI